MGFPMGRWSLSNEGLIDAQGELCTFLSCTSSDDLKQILQVSECGCMVTRRRSRDVCVLGEPMCI